MHKEIIKDEKQSLNQELDDINHLKLKSEKKYDKAEDYLDEQDKTITKVSNAIHRLRER